VHCFLSDEAKGERNAMATHKVGVLGGDGIGPEVIAQGLRVIAATGVVLKTYNYDLGGARYLSDGTVLPDEILEEWRGLDAIYLGAVGTPDVPPGVIERGLLLKMRFDLDLYINQRPFRSDRCISYAFDLATSRNNHLTLVHKTNVLTFSGDLWDRTFNEVGEEYPQVETAYNHVDAACIYFVQDPQRYDVIVTDNLFGDILTDLGGAVSGGIGLASSANLNPARTTPSMFEPVHGSAPDIAGQSKANPIAAILSGAHMLNFLGETEAADRIEQACNDCAHIEGSTSKITDAVLAKL